MSASHRVAETREERVRFVCHEPRRDGLRALPRELKPGLSGGPPKSGLGLTGEVTAGRSSPRDEEHAHRVSSETRTHDGASARLRDLDSSAFGSKRREGRVQAPRSFSKPELPFWSGTQSGDFSPLSLRRMPNRSIGLPARQPQVSSETDGPVTLLGATRVWEPASASDPASAGTSRKCPAGQDR